jgi:hypothetical protein
MVWAMHKHYLTLTSAATVWSQLQYERSDVHADVLTPQLQTAPLLHWQLQELRKIKS